MKKLTLTLTVPVEDFSDPAIIQYVVEDLLQRVPGVLARPKLELKELKELSSRVCLTPEMLVLADKWPSEAVEKVKRTLMDQLASYILAEGLLRVEKFTEPFTNKLIEPEQFMTSYIGRLDIAVPINELSAMAIPFKEN